MSTGEEPTAVIGKNSTKRHHMFKEVPEITEFEFEYASGIKATGRSSAFDAAHNLEVVYEDGRLVIDPYSTYNGLKGETSDGIIIKDEIPNQQAKQMDNDALAIMNDTPVLVPGEEGLRDIEIVQAILLSAKLGEKVYL